MSEENKKEIEKPQELNEEKSDAHAEAGACTWTNSNCGIGISWTSTTLGGCGSTTRSSCGMQENWSN